jgi:hypothetical protein
MTMPPGGYPDGPQEPRQGDGEHHGGAPEHTSAAREQGYGGASGGFEQRAGSPGESYGAPGQGEGAGQWGPLSGGTSGLRAGGLGDQDHGSMQPGARSEESTAPGQFTPPGQYVGPGPDPGQYAAPGQYAGPGQGAGQFSGPGQVPERGQVAGAGGQFGGPGAGWPAPVAARRRGPMILALLAVLAAALSVVAWMANRAGGDPKVQADKFMSAVQHGDYNAAKDLLCKDGKGQFSDINEMREKLAGGDISGYTIGDVSDATFEGDKRKEVLVSVQLADGTSDSVTLSMTRDSGNYLVCGF